MLVRENKKIKKKETKILHVKKGEFGRVRKSFTPEILKFSTFGATES